MKEKTCIFMGTPDFAVPTLTTLVDYFPDWSFEVFTQPDKPKGRGKHLLATPVKEKASTLSLQLHQPHTKSEIETSIQAIKPDIIIVIAYGHIIPKSITDQFLCINVHASLLPQYRGASPIHAALLNADKKTGNTLIRMNEKMDDGDILEVSELEIEDTDNLGSLHDKLAQNAAKTLKSYLKETPENKWGIGKPQDPKKASYCSKIQKEDLFLNPADSPKINNQKIKAFSPVPGAYLIRNDKRIKILEAKIENDKLLPLKVKPEGKKSMAYDDYKLGNPEGLTL